jgi:hypothetical protein
MAHSVVIENDAISMEVWPQIGGKVSSIVDKADHFELLFTYPAEIPEGPRYDVAYANQWYAGWDECFPAIAASKYAGHPYDGIPIPDHGELWGIPTTAVPTKDGITTVWHGLRFGYRLTRKLYLDHSSIVADYTLVNLSPFQFRFIWCMHALMGMNLPVQLDLTGPPLFKLSHDSVDGDINLPFDWPMANPGENLTVLENLPQKKAWKAFSVEAIESSFVVRYPTRGRTVQIEYTSEDELPAYWGVWINTGGWGGQRHFAIAPTTSRFDQLDRAIRDGSAGTIAGQGRRSWSVRWSLA